MFISITNNMIQRFYLSVHSTQIHYLQMIFTLES